jgi:inhibitor of KinA
MLRLDPLGDRAVLLTLADGTRADGTRASGGATGERTRARVQAAAHTLAPDAVSGHPAITDVVPAYDSVAVHYDPGRVACRRDESPHQAMARWIADRVTRLPDAPVATGRLVEIPVRYGGEDGPDLEALALARGLAPDDVVALHTAPEYVVHFLGFMPGFAYLGGLDERLATSRRAVPRTLVPAGSVGIGGAQTAVYPLASPGGWQLVGRTPLVLFDAAREPAALLAAGDRVRFRAL